VKILVKQEFYEAVGESVADAVPEAEFVLVAPDRSVVQPANGHEASPDFEIAWGSQGVFLEEGEGCFLDLVQKSTTLRWFQSPGAGNDQPIIKELLDRGVTVTGIHVHSVSISEYVMHAVLDHFQNAGAWREAQRNHEWAPHGFREISGSRWLIVGVGAIGTDVALRARAFGAHVVGVRRNPVGDEPVDEMIAPDWIEERLPDADVVVLATSANSSTRHMVNDSFLAKMRPGSILVNPARGSLIDDEALLRSMERGIPEAAAMDAFSPQPLPPDHPFWAHPRIAVTPHTSGRGSGRAARSAEFFTQNLRRYLKHEALMHEVLREAAG
jgi:phosphoglycerate dehydrogenase-like enzyme